MKHKDNIILILVVAVITVFLWQSDVEAYYREGSRTSEKTHKLMFLMVEDAGISHWEMAQVYVNYLENYKYDYSNGKITYYYRDFYYTVTYTGVYKNFSYHINLPKHINTKTKKEVEFLWKKAKYSLFPKCDVYGELENTSSMSYTALESENIKGQYQLIFSCDGALVPTKAETQTLRLSYK